MIGKKVLVTGGAGFIGSFLVERLLGRGYAVRVFDNLEPQVHPEGEIPDYLSKEAEFIKGDVRNYHELQGAIRGVEIVFHLAAMVGVGQSQYQVRKYTEVNVGGTANLLDILANSSNKVRKVIVASSMSAYGEGAYQCGQCGRVEATLREEEQMKEARWEVLCPECGRIAEPLPTNEAKPLECNSIYALTKKAQEEMTLNIAATYGIPAVALRFFNVFGPRQSLSNPYTGVVAIFMSRVKNGNPPVIYEDGLQTRDFICVHDIVEANLLAMDKREANYNVFNVGSGKPTSIKEIAELVIGLYKSKQGPLVTHKFRKGDVRHCFSDISRIKERLGFVPSLSLKDGMAELKEWSEGIRAEDKFDQAAQELKIRRLI